MTRIIWLFILSILLVGCAPKEFVPYEPPEIKFDKTENYDSNSTISNLSEMMPEKLEVRFLREVGNEWIEVDDPLFATHVVLDNNEYKKVSKIIIIAKSFKELAEKQTDLINNVYIAQINGFKELLELERAKAIQYRQLWVDSENLYRTEQYARQQDNIIHKASMFLITIGSLVLLVL